ncbi:MAG: peptide chain release factor family protein [Planctomycetota bacterium]
MDRRAVEITYVRSRGPGGQHRNKAETGVRLKHLPTGIVVTATERRSRAQNLEVAFERLAARVARALRPATPRVPTRATRASRERRLREKRRRSRDKTLRRGEERS